MVKKSTWAAPVGRNSGNPIIRIGSGRTRITEDDPLWNAKTMGNKKSGREVQIRVVKKKVTPRMKQYGDKGYKPATGSGTAH